MPTLTCGRSYLFKLLGRSFTDTEFEELCFKFGVELDDITTATEMKLRETVKGHASHSSDSQPSHRALEEEVLYKIDCPANRYDLLSTEGMATALRVFLGMMSPPCYKIHAPKPQPISMLIGSSVRGIREFVTCAVLRNITFTPDSYKSFIDLQEKLHQSLARKRTLVSVGTHDLDKVTPPFKYEAWPRDQVKFVPLRQSEELDCTGDGLERYYKDDKHIGRYVSLLTPFDRYPVVLDHNNKIMSLPPIINSNDSQISGDTKNIFIECTAVDKKKADVMLNLMVCAFSQYCAEPYSIEPVHVRREGCDTVEQTPNLNPRPLTCDVRRLVKQVGMSEELSAKQCCELLKKMQLECTPDDKCAHSIHVQVPPSRPDVLHECDVMEDLAISYGYDNLVMKPVPTLSVGTQTPVGKLTHLLRLELAAAGYTEILTLSMCSHDDAFKLIQRADDGKTAVCIANPQTVEFQVCRPTLLPGTLKTLSSNQNHALPIQLFEVTDVVLLDPTTRTGARNERRVAVLHCCSESSGFEAIHGVLDYFLSKLEVHSHRLNENRALTTSFMDGRGAEVLATVKGVEVSLGQLGVIHPLVLKNFDIPYPCAYLEVNLSPFI